MAAMGAICHQCHHHVMASSISFPMLLHLGGKNFKVGKKNGIGGIRSIQSSLSSSSSASPWHDWWKPDRGAPVPSLSDVIWPSAGAFAAMAIMGRIDHMLAPKGLSMTIAPLGAVSAILFATPASPGARKYNMFVAHIGCAFIGVLALSIFGAGWLARSTALAASIAFMIYTRSTHPPGCLASDEWRLQCSCAALPSLLVLTRSHLHRRRLTIGLADHPSCLDLALNLSCKLADIIHRWSQVPPLASLVHFFPERHWLHYPLLDTRNCNAHEGKLQVLSGTGAPPRNFLMVTVRSGMPIKDSAIPLVSPLFGYFVL